MTGFEKKDHILSKGLTVNDQLSGNGHGGEVTDAEKFVENIGNNAIETICNALQSFTEVSY